MFLNDVSFVVAVIVAVVVYLVYMGIGWGERHTIVRNNIKQPYRESIHKNTLDSVILNVQRRVSSATFASV